MADGTPKTTSPNGLRIYELLYKKGYVMTRMQFGGLFDLKTAIEKGKKFCTQKGLRFINVYEWLKDIDQLMEEKEAE